MKDKHFDPNRCNETSGFLFSHACERRSVKKCTQCMKPICEEHSSEFASPEETVLCTSCAKARIPEKDKGNSRGRGGSSRNDRYHDHDPYFYGGYYYGSGYHSGGYMSSSRHDPHDFTEADSQSLVGDSDEGFESDMSES